MTKEVVGIVGGAGAEGNHFASLLKGEGLDIIISDINTEKAQKMKAEGIALASSEELARESDLVLFSLPIDSTAAEIKRLAPIVRGSMADLTSIKTNAVEAMQENARDDAEIFSIHAMYRPTISPWGQNVLFIPIRPKEGGKWFDRIKGIMESKGANTRVLESAVRHDELAAPLQVLPQTIAYSFLASLEKFAERRGLSLEQIGQYSTVLFRLFLESAGRVVSDANGGGMYGSIQAGNPFTEEIYDLIISTLAKNKEMVVSGRDVASFATMHRRMNNFLGEYAKRAAEATDRRMGRPMGIEIFYEKELREEIEKALRGFRKSPMAYKGSSIETTNILDGELAKLRRGGIIQAKQVFLRAKESEEGIYGFYLKEKRIMVSPTIPEEGAHINHYVAQMLNRFEDPVLNLFDSLKRSKDPRLQSLERVIAYR